MAEVAASDQLLTGSWWGSRAKSRALITSALCCSPNQDQQVTDGRDVEHLTCLHPEKPASSSGPHLLSWFQDPDHRCPGTDLFHSRTDPSRTLHLEEAS